MTFSECQKMVIKTVMVIRTVVIKTVMDCTVEDPFWTRFCPSEKAKEGHPWISEENLTKISDNDFLLGSFSIKGDKYLFFVCTFKFSMFLISKTVF